MLPTFAEDPIKGIESSLLEDALSARKRWLGAVRNDRYVTIIDFGKRSNEKRFYLVDLQTRQAQSFFVAHGKGTDPDHDGQADVFSNSPDSKMTSLGALDGGGGANHTKFAETEEKINLIRSRAAAGATAEDGRRLTLSEHAGAVIISLGQGLVEVTN